jgi:hypothetical protein
MTNEDVKLFSKRWTEAWSSHDLEAIMALFSDELENTTPIIRRLYGIENGTLKGKPENEKFWKTLLEKYPDAQLSALEVWEGINVVAIHWHFYTQYSPTQGAKGNDTFFFDPQGLVYKVATTHQVN